MPRLLSLAAAFGLWMFLEEHQDWVREPDPAGLAGMLGLSWVFALRWSAVRQRRPWEARPLFFFLLPLLSYGAFLSPFGGLRLWRAWELPALASSWIGLVPYLALQFPYRYGEGAVLGLATPGALRFAWRQTSGLLLGILPLALVAQSWELGEWLLPETPEAWSGPERLAATVVDVGAPLLVLPLVVTLLPRFLGASGPAAEWQPVVDRLWAARGAAPRVLFWPTQGLLANALAVGFGPWRRVLLSDRLLERLRPHEVEAVLAHELSHLRRAHAFSLLCGVVGGGLAASAALAAFWPASQDPPLTWTLAIAAVALALAVPASRVFEMQADLDAASVSHAVRSSLVGVLTFLGSHSARLGIRHLPARRRVAELELCLADPGRGEAWQRRARAWRLGLRALLPLGAVAAAAASL